MKLNKVTIAMLAAGFVATNMATAATLNLNHGIGDRADMAPVKEARIALAEMFASLTAARVSSQWQEYFGNPRCSGVYDFELRVQSSGTGTGTYDGIDFTVTNVTAAGDVGRTYDVADVNGVIPGNGIANVTGKFIYGPGSAILLADADFQLDQGAAIDWDEHIIKDFWKEPCVAGVPVCHQQQNIALPLSKTTMVVDAGLEVVTKEDYPKSKWVQNSNHTEIDGGDGGISIVKELVSEQLFGGEPCMVDLLGVMDQTTGYIKGDIIVF